MITQNPELAPDASRVLVADDDKTTLFLLQRTLLKWGFEVYAASDGLEALELAQEHKVRLVVSD